MLAEGRPGAVCIRSLTGANSSVGARWGATVGDMSEASPLDDPLAGWEPRRREALERLWDAFSDAGARERSLSDELISERRADAEVEDHRVSLR